jgi:hypothetical protein
MLHCRLNIDGSYAIQRKFKKSYSSHFNDVVISTQALLSALGMGTGSLPIAATLNWIIKDGFGLLGGVFYTSLFRCVITVIFTAALIQSYNTVFD